MLLKEIQAKSWKVKENFEVSKNSLASLSLLEQECHLNILRKGFETEGREILVCCSDQTMITELAKSEFFFLESVLVSSHERNKDFVLEVKGKLEPSGITIRKKIPVFSDEEKQRRAERLRNIRTR